MSAHLELILGCMFAGKTSEFIRRYHKYKRLGKNILVINHRFDERYGKGMVKVWYRYTDKLFLVYNSITNSPEI